MISAGTGLRGQSVGSTAVSTVGKEGVGLTYRGYTIEELAGRASFEEVAFLLIYGELPSQAALDEFRLRLKQKRQLPEQLKQLLELIPAGASQWMSFAPLAHFWDQLSLSYPSRKKPTLQSAYWQFSFDFGLLVPLLPTA
jgi:2-methylcitrate synthase